MNNTDRLTTILGLVTVVAIALQQEGIYPQITGAIAAVSGAIFAYLTNKTSVLPSSKGENYGARHTDRHGSRVNDPHRGNS